MTTRKHKKRGAFSAPYKKPSSRRTQYLRLRRREAVVAWECPGDVARAGHGQVFAAIDLGTNNCRQLIARFDRKGLHILDSWSRITRLGEGVVETNQLSEQAMQRSIEALSICADRQQMFGVSAQRAITTEACRRAGNGVQFAQRVENETGLRLDIISGEQEASYAIAGCESLMASDMDNFLVFDIGGGSTELVHVRRGEAGLHIASVISLPVGVVTMMETWGKDCGEDTMMQSVHDDVANRIASWNDRSELEILAKNNALQLIGTSGTVTTMAALSMGLERYQRKKVDGATIRRDHIMSVRRSLEAMTMQARRNHDCIGAGRADLVLPGAAIVDAILSAFPVERITVADRGIREGVLIEMARSSVQAGESQAKQA